MTQESQCTLVNFALVIALTHKVIEDAADAKDTIGQDKGGGRCEWREREDWMMRWCLLLLKLTYCQCARQARVRNRVEYFFFFLVGKRLVEWMLLPAWYNEATEWQWTFLWPPDWVTDDVWPWGDRDLLAIKCTGSSNSPVMRGEREREKSEKRKKEREREKERRSLFFEDWARENSSLVYSSGHSREKKPV